MTELSEKDRALAEELLVAWDGPPANREETQTAIRCFPAEAVALCATARRLVTADLAAQAMPDMDLLELALGLTIESLPPESREPRRIARNLVDAIRPTLAAPQARAEAAESENKRLRDELRALYRGYVNTLENFRDRLELIGQPCEDVPTMEAKDPHLRRTRAAIRGEHG